MDYKDAKNNRKNSSSFRIFGVKHLINRIALHAGNLCRQSRRSALGHFFRNGSQPFEVLGVKPFLTLVLHIHNHGIFATRIVSLRPIGQIGRRHRIESFELFREFTSHHNPASGMQHAGQILEKIANAVRCLIKHKRLFFLR